MAKKVLSKSGDRPRVRRRIKHIDKVFPGISYKQYINMVQGPNRTRKGRKITISARVKPAKAGITVEWLLDTPSAPHANRSPSALSLAERPLLSGVSSATNDKGVAEITLTLSSYGGDKFRVGARITGTSNYIYSGWFQVWRMLYYDIVEMKTEDGSGKYEMPPNVMNRIKSGFAKSFIELKDTGIRHLGDYKDNFDDVEKGFKWADGKCSNKGVPQKIHFCVIDHAAPWVGSYGAQTKVVEEYATAIAYTSSGKIRPYDFSGHSWLIKAEYRTWRTSGARIVGTVWRAFPPGRVTLVGKRGMRKFKVDFSGTGRTPTATNKVKIRITYWSPGSYGGWGGADCLHLLICRGEYLDITTVANANDQIVVAGMHEPGHAMELVPASAAWHDAAHDSHCVHNRCTMWWESKAGNEAFHNETVSDPGCRTLVRGKDLTKSALQNEWKFPR